MTLDEEAKIREQCYDSLMKAVCRVGEDHNWLQKCPLAYKAWRRQGSPDVGDSDQEICIVLSQIFSEEPS